MKYLVTLIIALAAGFVGAQFGSQTDTASQETAFERMVRTGTIRCGYGVWPPMVIKDPNTGEMSGLMVDLMTMIAADTGYTVEWTQEIDWGQVPEAFKSGKIDLNCAGLWATSYLADKLAFSDPLLYTPVLTAVRADDTRFDDGFSGINNENITISVGDNEASYEIATKDFPQAKLVHKSPLAGYEMNLINVATGKADVTFSEHSIVIPYMANNPGQIKLIHEDNPIRLYGSTIAADIHEHELIMFFNTALNNVIQSGRLDRLFTKYSADYDMTPYVTIKKVYE